MSETRQQDTQGNKRWDKRWLIVIPGSIALGLLLDYFNVPAGWILAAILVSGAVALISHRDLPLNQSFYTISRGFIGMMAAIPLTVAEPTVLLTYLPAALLFGVVTLVFCMFAGYLLFRVQRNVIDIRTGILSMLPGGASMMPVMAAEVGADVRYVSLTQYLRLLVVSMTLPLMVGFMATPASGDGTPAFATEASTLWWVVAITVAIAVFGEKLGRLAHLPVPSVLGPVIITVLVSLTLPADVTLQPLEVFRIMAFISIGWVCGGGLDMTTLKHFASRLPATFGLIALVIGLCALLAWPLALVYDVTYFEAYLATSPGALETVLALSAEGHAGPIVVSIQIIRLLLVIGLAGYLPTLLKRWT